MADYIDRQKAIDLIAEKQMSLCPPGRWGRSQAYGSDRDEYDSLEEAMDQLENIPAADVAPVVHGEWMRHSNKLWRYCSVCLEDALMSRSTGAEVLSETCPNCGAKMDGETTP